MRILLVEDDEIIAESVAELLRKQGYSVDCSGSLEDGGLKVFEEPYDCIVLDRGLPDGDGISLIPTVREHLPDASILVLTARNRSEDVITGLDSGADDYLGKPFLPRELLARVRALLRRGSRRGNPSRVTVGEIAVDTSTQTVTKAGRVINVSPREYALLEYLLIHRGEAQDRQSLLEHVWGEGADMFSNTVDVHIRYLRKKLDSPGQVSLIKTVKGKGYRI